MSYDRQFLRLTIEHYTVDQPEMAQTGLLLSAGVGFNALDALADVTTANLTSICDTWATTLQHAVFQWADYSHVSRAKIAAVGTDGHDLTEPLSAGPTADQHGSATQIHPQLSIEIGLWSGHKFGVANYGKMYLPHTAFSLDTVKCTTYPGNLPTALGYMQSWINGLTGLAGGWTGTPIPVIMSRLGTGTTKGVTQLRTGVVTDTQRRRRDKIPESLVSVTL